MKVLIVEDEVEIAELMAEVLNEDIPEILIAEDGLEALEVLKENPDITCLITDINMPRMDGITLCQKLQEISPELPVFMITAELGLEEKARAAGAIDVLIKPFMMEEFHSWVLEKMTVSPSAKKS